ncbi:MAG: VOC family protein, partial [Deltaproteobacteria bacterium]|nr:VOC family protein [Deltaproteobacteria bacterium]
MMQTSPAKVKATELTQVGLVVKDVQKTAENYWNILGIGPWDIYELHAPVLSDVVYHGKPTQFSMKLGVAMVGKVQLGLFEPVSGDSIYSDFLAEYGEGLHHLQFAAD